MISYLIIADTILIILIIIGIFILKKRLFFLFKGKKGEDLQDLLISLQKNNEILRKEQTDIRLVIEELLKIGHRSIQKIGVIRFNPFNDIGGDQSFVVALLDTKNNGVVISSLYARDSNRIYSKPIENGSSRYQLSDEEKQAIEKAIQSS